MKNVITPSWAGGFLLCACAATLLAQFINTSTTWTGYAHDPQHTALSAVQAQPLNRIKWHTPVDENVISGTVGAHYGSVAITPGNLVLVPVRLYGTNSFAIRAINGNTASGANPTPIYTLSSDFVLPSSPDWIPSYSGVLTAFIIRAPAGRCTTSTIRTRTLETAPAVRSRFWATRCTVPTSLLMIRA